MPVRRPRSTRTDTPFPFASLPRALTPMVFPQLREDLSEETVRSVARARRVIVHYYNAIAPAWRESVFQMSVPQIIAMVEHHIALFKRLTAAHPQTQWVLQYSPETFCMAELDRKRVV